MTSGSSIILEKSSMVKVGATIFFITPHELSTVFCKKSLFEIKAEIVYKFGIIKYRNHSVPYYLK